MDLAVPWIWLVISPPRPRTQRPWVALALMSLMCGLASMVWQRSPRLRHSVRLKESNGSESAGLGQARREPHGTIGRNDERMTDKIFGSILLAIVAVAAISIIRNTLRRRDYRRRLVARARTRRRDELSRQDLATGHLVATSSPLGTETWWFPNGTDPLPRADGGYDEGLLIEPEPRYKCLKKFCEEHGITLTQRCVKFK